MIKKLLSTKLIVAVAAILICTAVSIVFIKSAFFNSTTKAIIVSDSNGSNSTSSSSTVSSSNDKTGSDNSTESGSTTGSGNTSDSDDDTQLGGETTSVDQNQSDDTNQSSSTSQSGNNTNQSGTTIKPDNTNQSSGETKPGDTTQSGSVTKPDSTTQSGSATQPDQTTDSVTPQKPASHTCQFEFSSHIAATCTQKGKDIYKCACGKQQVTTLDAIGHNYKLSKTVASTETTAGYKLFVCANCSSSYKENLPLALPAYKLETCSSSLLGKALPHTNYYNVMVSVMKRFQNPLTKEASLAAGTIALPSYNEYKNVVEEYNTVYNYISCTMPYSLDLNAENKTAGFLCWSPDDKYQILQDSYAEVYRILKSLKITSETTKWDAIYRINDYLCENRVYEKSSSYLSSSKYRYSSTYYSVFSGKASCYNYAIAFQMLCLGAGIECHYYPSQTMNHAWNRVYFNDGSSFWVDTCWNDVQYMFKDGRVVETSVANGVPAATVKKFRETYLLITTKQLLEDHTL